MGLLFEQIDSQPSVIGEITLRRRRIPAIGDRDIYEVKLGEEFLMSSMFVDAEVAFSDIGLGETEDDEFMAALGEVFTDVACHVVSFFNTFQNRESFNTVYVARKPG